MSNHRNRWTAEDDERLTALWQSGAEVDEIAELLERSHTGVVNRVRDLVLPARLSTVPWTRAEHDMLRELFRRGLSDAEIAARLDNRSINAIGRQRSNLGLVRRAHRQFERPPIIVGPARTCQWIEGEYAAGDADPFCGKPSVEGKSYCAAHALRCYRQNEPAAARQSAASA